MMSSLLRAATLVESSSFKAVIDRILRPLFATREVTLSARKVVQRICWPATGITAHSL